MFYIIKYGDIRYAVGVETDKLLLGSGPSPMLPHGYADELCVEMRGLGEIYLAQQMVAPDATLEAPGDWRNSVVILRVPDKPLLMVLSILERFGGAAHPLQIQCAVYARLRSSRNALLQPGSWRDGVWSNPYGDMGAELLSAEPELGEVLVRFTYQGDLGNLPSPVGLVERLSDATGALNLEAETALNRQTFSGHYNFDSWHPYEPQSASARAFWAGVGCHHGEAGLTTFLELAELLSSCNGGKTNDSSQPPAFAFA